jgi:hypothetical protein
MTWRALSKVASVSVAMATFNGQSYLHEQLESIAHQTLLPVELVITDDGSTDATLQIVEEFARNAPFSVKLTCNEARLGYADNFMKAASLCTGDLIAFCDQDDVWMVQKLSVCSQLFADPEMLAVGHSAYVLLPGRKFGQRYPDYHKTRIFEPASSNPLRYPWGFALVFRRTLLEIAPSDYRPAKVSAHDQWVWFLASSLGKTALVKDALTLYRQHPGNTFGPPPHRTLVQRLRGTAAVTNFDDLADSELQCSHILAEVAATHPELGGRVKSAVASLRYRARLHRLRTRIYQKSAGFIVRVGVFGNILLTGGYLPDSSGTRIGPYHAVKDLCLGVMGLHKVLNSPKEQ